MTASNRRHGASGRRGVSADGRRRLRSFALVTAVTAVAVVLSYLFVDRPFARFSHDVLRPHEFLAWTTGFNRFLQPAAIVALAAVGVYGLLGRRLTNWQTFVLLACTVYLVTRGFRTTCSGRSAAPGPSPGSMAILLHR